MKRLLIFAMTVLALCSCNNETINFDSKPELPIYNLTAQNYDKFFVVQNNVTYRNTTITPRFNKHLNYKDVVFNFKTDYSIETSFHQYTESTYTFNLKVDETGNAEGKYVNTNTNLHSYKVELVSIEGVVSFSDGYSFFDKIEKASRDAYHKEDIGVYYNFSGSEKYKIIFKADLNVSETADTDAFYIIESVTIKFKTTVNNVSRDFEYTLYPNFYGIAEIPIEKDDNSILENQSFAYTNGYYLVY